MYQKYQTDALVLGSFEQGEADKAYVLFTKDFGLVRAKASAVRREASRMRYALQSYSFANVSLVRGKRAWRLAGARAIEGFSVAENLKGTQAFGRIAVLVTKLVAGEEKNEYLFDVLVEAHRALMNTSAEAVPTIEIVCVARILYALGYISAEALSTTLFSHTQFGSDHLQEAEISKELLLASINRAIAQTHL